jgi:Cu/Ag efflux protein CusF
MTALVLATLVACGGSHQHDEAASGSAPPTVYSVRGVVSELPPEGQPPSWMRVEHEAIPDFIGIGGDPEPMHAMTMRFPVAEGVDLGTVAVGDKVAFELEVDYNASEIARILSLSPLPPETELELADM